MSLVKLANGIELHTASTPTKEQKVINGRLKNVLIFKFDDSLNISDFDLLFKEKNTESLFLSDQHGVYRYNDYVLDTISKTRETVLDENGDENDVVFVEVVLCQRTYLEKKAKELDEKMNLALLAITELYEKGVK